MEGIRLRTTPALRSWSDLLVPDLWCHGLGVSSGRLASIWVNVRTRILGIVRDAMGRHFLV